MATRKKLFITYAWVDNQEGDFDFITQRLEAAGIDVRFDRIQFVRGRRIWDEIGKVITSSEIDGWAFLVTPDSLKSEPCIEEYHLALQRALSERGGQFPLVAMVHKASFNELPPSLKLRLGVNLATEGWPEEVVAALEGRPPRIPIADLLPFSHTLHAEPDGKVVVELRPRLGTTVSWRAGVQLAERHLLLGYGEGKSGHPPAGLSLLFLPVDEEQAGWRMVGAQGPVGAGVSAYLYFGAGALPKQIFFGEDAGQQIKGTVMVL